MNDKIKKAFDKWFDHDKYDLSSDVMDAFHAGYTADKWIYTEPPRSKPILRWHTMWKCPVSVEYWPEKERLKDMKDCEWLDVTKTRAWSEEAFEPNAWQELPEAPE